MTRRDKRFELVQNVEAMLCADICREVRASLFCKLDDHGLYIDDRDMDKIIDWLYCAVREYAEPKPLEGDKS